MSWCTSMPDPPVEVALGRASGPGLRECSGRCQRGWWVVVFDSLQYTTTSVRSSSWR